MPLPTGPWRGLGLVPNLFPIESFMDGAASPCRRQKIHCSSAWISFQPIRRADGWPPYPINAAAESAGWGGALPAGRGQGIACCFYHGTVVAEVAEISLDEPTGRIRFHRVVAALDCGRAINPDQVRSQMEGSIVMGASAALLEELTVEDWPGRDR